MELLPHEMAHLKKLEEISSECALFFKRDHNFPVKNLKEVALFGNGVRNTYRGGTGSGNVNVRCFSTIEEAFKARNIKITTKQWLDKYDEIQSGRKKGFVKRIKKEAKKARTNAAVYSVGCTLEEGEYNVDYHTDAEVVIYVLSRIAGEGKDREPIKGDFYLTDTEIKTINDLNEKHEKFLLVLNVVSPLDLSPILGVRNILLLSQLGSLTSETLVDIVLGNKYPSGKLATTWAKLSDYPSYKNFGDINDTNYEEGIYVGYRYFDAFSIKPIFEFGYGLSYTDFDFKAINVSHNKDVISIDFKVTNIGDFRGKEVIQLYLKKPQQKLDNPPQILVNFKKTKELKPGENDLLSLSFKLSDFPNFDTVNNAYILQSGIYQISAGNSSRNLFDVCSINLKDEIIVKKVKQIDDKPKFVELINPHRDVLNKLDINIDLSIEDFENAKIVKYLKYDVGVSSLIDKLTDEELVLLSLGDIKGGVSSMIGNSCSKVMGGAGETTLKIKSIPETLAMCDGPAGIRITKEYVISKGKNYAISVDPLWEELGNYIPKFIMNMIFNAKKNAKRSGERIYQYATSIPVASALAQSFSSDVISICGDIIREEMEIYNVDLWLAPAMNIHRHPLCGRNFEYYSEDPYLTGFCASTIINSVQKNTHKGTVIKHFVGNNQETNRTNSSSNMSIRALREIYLSGFKTAIEKSHPVGVMASYNLVNGAHVSENYDIINDILRCEFAFDGLVMTDWIVTGQLYNKASQYPGALAHQNLLAGVNLSMPGGKSDIKDIRKAMKDGKVTRENLLHNGEIVYKTIRKLKDK